MMPNDEHILEGDAVVERLVQVEEVVLDDGAIGGRCR